MSSQVGDIRPRGVSIDARQALPASGAAPSPAQPADSYRPNTVEGANERLSPYILVPSEQLKKEGGTSKLIEKLRRLNVLVGDQIPLLGAFTATLNDEARRKVEQAGFKVIPDDQGRFLHPEPWERSPNEVPHDVHGRAEVSPRPPLSAPRFFSPLTQKFTGKGIGIAVVDTGIYPHPDFNNPYNRIVAFKDFVNDRPLPYDDNGHGSLVAGNAAGNGFLSRGLYRGPAPDANLIGVKVLGRSGNGQTSNILKGINWVVENKDRYNIRVLNLSLGNSARPANPADDPIQQAVEKAVKAGIVVVVSAGNEGPYEGTLSAPADNPNVITVGAVDDRNTPDRSDDRIPDFSSRGWRDGRTPDVVAPGEAIIGPSVPNSPTEETALKYSQVHQTLGWMQNMEDKDLVQIPEDTLRLIGLNSESIRRFKASPYLARMELNRLLEATERLPIIDSKYVGMPGTSLAAPIVSGVVAQLLEANPSLTPQEVKEILRATAVPLEGYGVEAQGAGAINPHAALELALKKKQQAGDMRQMTIDDFGVSSNPGGARPAPTTRADLEAVR